MTGTYEHNRGNHACCLSDKSFHQRCVCVYNNLTYCESECSKDKHCKGYVAFNMGLSSEGCDLATSSQCPSHCKTQNVGNVGPLLFGATCGGYYGGCYIKYDERM